MKRNNQLMIAAILSVSFLGGCEIPGVDSLLNSKSSAAPINEASAGTQPTETGQSKTEETTPDTNNAKTVLAKLPTKLILAPGATAALPQGDQLTYQTSAPSIVSVKGDGTLVVSKKAAIGDRATVNISLQGEQKEISIEVKASLKDTLTNQNGVATVTNPTDRLVVVNKQRALPVHYVPADLVEPKVPFSFQGKSEKRMMRAEAAKALEQLFAQAEKEKFQLVAVSGYRSEATQKGIFASNVNAQGYELAARYSAQPGKSEHQTGLAIDVAGPDRKTLLEDTFANTAEGKWLADNAAKFGFIIRYPKGKEQITGYAYEPWHIRFVGVEVAKEISEQGITLEEYFQDTTATPVKQ